MAKIAWHIAHAFTQGHKSAPAAFREVENQLYSLSAALTAFKDICGTDLAAVAIDPSKLPTRFQTQEQDGMQSVAGILDSCYETLKHLEKIVENYGVVVTPKDPAKSRFRRWSIEMTKNYKKIAWTTEAGDLAALRSQLMVHTNSLNLVLGIIVSSRTTRIEDGLKNNSAMLQEIYSWWSQNLKDVAGPQAQKDDLSLGLQGASNLLSFEVHLISNGTPQILCSHASLHDDWKETGSMQLFVCRCSQPTSGHPRVEKIALSPLSFPFRQAGDTRSWTLFKALDKSTGQMVSVTVKNVAASGIIEFEETFIQPLAEARANAMLRQGISNQLAHLSPDEGHIRALNLQSDLKDCHKLIDSVTFRVGHRNLSKPRVDGLSLLNYRELGQQTSRSLADTLDHAELSIYYGSEGMGESTDVTKSVVHSAKKLHEKLEDMRVELLVTSLQYPRPDDVVALHLQATEVQCEVAIIPDAELLITRNSRDEHRLIVASRNRCTVLSQVLPHSFFDSLSSTPSFTAPTWLVQLEGNGKRKVYHYPDGFRFLSFRNTSAEKMFELGRTAVLQGAGPEKTLPLR
ncbi:hypothetical protein CHGG_07603 [Chaetomium globosum CBS 148.51]|uniref:Fungal N-terminal domain-containing protein n=1 Tax=Chaetomium globosum (strain ATCC 6205 / CBS 148.51 / DSM 1962 / NBRC 6347 / NRRL 1970) TaxID=306901 RepID=Q2GWQ1_CHAGB|nr:uncharacterized protein CHGG_07603 [Chaetomium globosum CBS 148.51]EAQ86350.1 hypothetical protein CHGG_07603 [Chaetomium globosum CBS 148.51]